MSKPLISVIIPCFNAEAYLQGALDCVFGQTFSNVELIAIDDGSSDKTFTILSAASRKYPALVALQQANQGPYPARNAALTHAKGDYIAFLDADDYWSPDCLEKLYRALLTGNADLSYCGWQNIVENGEDGPPYVPPAYESDDIYRAFLKGCPWPIHAALIKRSVVDRVGGFSTRCFSSMDYDFWIRVSAVTQKMIRVPEVLAFYRWHQRGQISSVKWRQVLDARQVKTDFIAQHPELVDHIPAQKLHELTNGYVLKQAYTAFWKRDLVSAQKLFRACWRFGFANLKDAKYILLSFLPTSFFQTMIRFVDRN
ncbi:MAG: glycosyltransferase [Gammaproteobacteria bacterium]|nr:glycosyltransferase [Gammaproteobacteria bacterium]